MPFKSQAQRRFLFARHPKIAEEFASKTSSISELPEKVKKKDCKMKILGSYKIKVK